MERMDEGRGEYFYKIPPIDNWAGWMTLEEWAGQAYGRDAGRLEPGWGASVTANMRAVWTLMGLEGNGTIFIAPLPRPDSCNDLAMYATKSTSKGTCFIASPYPLPWLDEYGYDDGYGHFKFRWITPEIGVRHSFFPVEEMNWKVEWAKKRDGDILPFERPTLEATF